MIDRETPLARAFRWRMQQARKFAGPLQGSRLFPEELRTGKTALNAHAAALADVAAGKARYPSDGRWQAPHKGRPFPAVTWQPDSPGLAHIESPEAAGLRHVGDVEAESRRGDIWSTRGPCGWYTDPHGDSARDGTGLCWGVVYQLPGKAGAARFVAGYQFGGTDSGPSLDLGTIYREADCRAFGYPTDATDLDAARHAGRAADSMAQAAAEKERDYQTAWQAGRQWADLGEELETSREAVAALLRERKAIRGKVPPDAFPALCGAIRGKVADLLQEREEARDKRAALISGEAPGLYWYAGETRLQNAFCEAAGLSAFPS